MSPQAKRKRAAASVRPAPSRPGPRRTRGDILPPTLDGRTLKRIGRLHQEDALQEAWVAYLESADPDSAVWSYLKKVRRAQRRCVCFSQLPPDEQRFIQEELPG